MTPDASSTTSIELLLDDAAEARVRADWDALASAGMSSMAAHPGASNRPHVTLLARSTAVPHPLLVDAALPLPVVLGAPLLLGDGDRRVLARSLVPTAALLELQAAVVRAAGPSDDARFAPGAWTPHVTLAKRIRLDDLPHALGLLGPPIEARGVALRRWDAATATISPVPVEPR